MEPPKTNNANPIKKILHGWSMGRVPCTGPGPFFLKKWVGRWKEGGAMCPSLSPKDRYASRMGVPHFVLCKNGCQRAGGPNGNEKDMCWLASYGDQVVRSPRVHRWVLQANLLPVGHLATKVKWGWPPLPVTFIKCHVLSFSKLGCNNVTSLWAGRQWR